MEECLMATEIDVDPADDLGDSPPAMIDRVALYGGSDRLSTIRGPLEAVGVEVALNPERPADVDVTIVFSPGRTLFEALVEGVDGPLVYRLSGDYWTALAETPLGRLRSRLADRLFRRVDGALTPDARLDGVWRERTNVRSTASVGIPVDVDEWPTRTHRPGPLRCLTLGNFDYAAKTDPLIDWLPYVNRALGKRNGTWSIAGDGRHADRLAAAVEPYPHIEYVGYVDARRWLAETDVLLHPSHADIAYPNAVCEALASRVPVLASRSPPFAPNRHVCSPADLDALPTILQLLRNPKTRHILGERGRRYIASVHAPDRVGEQIRHFLTALTLAHQFDR